MSLRAIVSSRVTPWEEALAATIFLKELGDEGLAVNEKAQFAIRDCLATLRSLPWPYAKEICYQAVKDYVACTEPGSTKKQVAKDS